ncbi:MULTISPECIES: hypothetical protein [unclassified Mycobacterium]|uniref:hypothetical protein n=1 Tax=unclassified Mycobacterium TaxID=2642494 RepID=UPI0006DC2428|nr:MULTISPECIES: hypothetical protein [unclassified Mycobacterium]
MADIDTRSALGLITILIGLAHFLVPRIFDPFNRLGFPGHAREFTHLHGAIETTIGVLLLRARTRRPSTVVSACYLTYLTISILRTQLRTRRGQRSG